MARRTFAQQSGKSNIAHVGGRTAFVALRGFDELQEALAGITDEVQRDLARGAVTAGGQVAVRAVKKKAPRGDKIKYRDKATDKRWKGKDLSKMKNKKFRANLKDSVFQLQSWKWKKKAHMAKMGLIATKIAFRYPFGNHAHLVEFGHKKVLWGKRTAEHVPAYPFFRPAIREANAAIVSAMSSKIKSRLPAAVARAVKKRKAKAAKNG